MSYQQHEAKIWATATQEANLFIMYCKLTSFPVRMLTNTRKILISQINVYTTSITVHKLVMKLYIYQQRQSKAVNLSGG